MEKSSNNNKIQYVRNIPKFLNQYKNLLVTNKKNYLNEELGHEEQEENEEEREERSLNNNERENLEEELIKNGAIIVNLDENKKGIFKNKNSYRSNSKNEEFVLTEVPKMSDLLPDIPEREEGEREEREGENEKSEIEYYKEGKILFHNKSTNKKRDVNETIESETSQQTNKKQKQQKQKVKNLLSFDEEN